jgi:hypothetical protein
MNGKGGVRGLGRRLKFKKRYLQMTLRGEGRKALKVQEMKSV